MKDTSVFSKVKDSVSAPEAALYYGFAPNKAGFIRCPWHADKKPSLKLYEGTRGCYCYACGKGGSVIDLVAALHGVPPKVALRMINEDFGLGLNLDRQYSSSRAAQVRAQRKRENEFQAWRERSLNACALLLRIYEDTIRQVDEKRLIDDESAAILRGGPYIEWTQERLHDEKEARIMFERSYFDE